MIETTDVDAFTVDAGEEVLVTAEAGATIDRLLHALVPQGAFVPVTPGTRYVTVGGAIAADIHGKNHHRQGSFCDHVRSLRLQLPSGDVVRVGPDDDPELFWATAGGMGLTGTVLDATFTCPRIGSSRLLVDTDRAADLDGVLELMEGDDAYAYSVAWIDLMARGRDLGRSVLTRGRFATAEEVGRARRRTPTRPASSPPLPPFVPRGLLNRVTVAAFNELWFRRAPERRRDELQTIPTFFHPLDMVGGWNRIYGPGGFLQWQFVVPFGAEEQLRHIVGALSAGALHLVPRRPQALRARQRRARSRSRSRDGRWRSTSRPPCPGWARSSTGSMRSSWTQGAGSTWPRTAGSRRDRLAEMYPRLDEWRAVRERVDPHRRLQSDLARRLGL